jgi:hypothetical protein
VRARRGPTRRLAAALMRHAARIMPVTRADWSAAMESEMSGIEDDGEALRWALGCVTAGYRERMNAMNLLQTWYARSALACLIVLLSLREFFAPMLIVAYRMKYLGLAHFLGLRTAGDDYRRLIPVMDATPSWLVALWVVAGLLYLVALWQMLRRSGASHVPFLLGCGLDLAGLLALRSLEASTGVIVSPIPMVRIAGFLLTFSVGFVLWRMTRIRTKAVN